MNLILSIALGGAIGSVMRYFSVAAWTKAMGGTFPYGTLFVNVLGSFLIGFLAEMMVQKWQVSPETRAFLITGILGGFTTFSAFSLDVFKLVETNHPISAMAYVAASLFVSLLAVFGGAYLARQFV